MKFLIQSTTLILVLGIAACANPGGSPTEASNATPAVNSAPGIAPLAAPADSPVRSNPSVVAPEDYRIGPQDLLKVEVFGAPDLNRSVRVSASGQIGLPLIGAVPAAGLTGEQLAAEIAARLARDYLQEPQVTIFIEEFTSQRVVVTGAVKSPNVFPIKGRTTLLQVVAAAGGPTSVANLGSVRILRTEPGGARQMLLYDLRAISDGQAPDPEVQGEDVVQIDASALKETAKNVIEFIMPFRFFYY